MTDKLSWSAVAEWLAGFAPEGPLRTAVLLVYGLCVAVAPFIYWYYLGVLAQGAAPEGSLERQDYDKLRASLGGDSLAARLYAKWLTKFLDWIEHFFGDVGLPNRTPFLLSFLRLRDPAPLWTAPAFDRCLLLASCAVPLAWLLCPRASRLISAATWLLTRISTANCAIALGVVCNALAWNASPGR